MGKMVEVRWEDVAPISDERLDEMRGLANRPDSEIDFSDIPEWTDDQFKNAVRGKFYRPRKEQITAKVDQDVIAWLKADGPGYQTRLNAILREAMIASLKKERKAA